MPFKILKGDSSRISTDITPLHDGWAYFAPGKENRNDVIGAAHDIADEQLQACRNGGFYICKQGGRVLGDALTGDVPPYDIPVVIILLG